MLFDDDFSLDGVSARSLGIIMQNNFVFEGAEPDVNTVSVSGRNGALHIYTGAWLNLKGSVSCYIAEYGVAQNIARLARFIEPMKGYQRLEVMSDEGFYRMARVVSMPENAVRLEFMAPFTLTFDCKPQHYLKVGDIEVEIGDGDSILNPTLQKAYPIIRLTGSGEGSITVNGYTVNVSESNGAVIDSELMKGYNQSTGDLVVSRGSEFPVLDAGSNEVSFTGGITGVYITPRWYEV